MDKRKKPIATIGLPDAQLEKVYHVDDALTHRARALLTTTTQSVQQIADTLGFQNQSHFGTFFRRHAGCSPKHFRTSPTQHNYSVEIAEKTD